ncbi:Hsp20/alpha crystallin family protein [Hyphomonas johnsonii]|uniref:Molecular chaperone, heat shock Hsp20 family protein n=1 Tax=Hyphomonas johnsonii MHS-2 TaxID=1280950 RepID=A0A059FFZ4_9PROT|nr:Hsp20/alpha crystallin family protein [Hyphomonas johnsonii]KCZ89448.1 molecular chaperone, heat shock Hsp20 family protein [Hyphomonas johnsonii MHS-2]
MSFRDLIPFGNRSNLPVLSPANDPFETLHREIDRLFQDVWQGKPFGTANGSANGAIRMPEIEVSETDKAYAIEADLPGMSEDDVEVSVVDGVLTIAGERRHEEERKEKGVQYSERSYGMFKRSLQLPADVNEDDIKASFKNGVIHVELPKSPEKIEKVRRVAIKKAS